MDLRRRGSLLPVLRLNPRTRLTIVSDQGTSTTPNNASPKAKKDEPTQELTPLEKMLQNAAAREDGTDKFFGLENVRCKATTTNGGTIANITSSVW